MKLKDYIIVIIITCIVLIFGTCLFAIHEYRTAFEIVQAELLKARQEIQVLKTFNSSQEYYLADEKRKVAAYEEKIMLGEE